MGKKILRFLIYSNLFVAGCVVLMVDQTYRFLLQSAVNHNFLFFVFFSTLCSYSFHWYLTTSSVIPSPRITWLKKYRMVHIVLFFIGLAGAGIFFFYLLPHWHWLLVAVLITFFYSAPKIPHKYFRMLRKIAYGKTFFLAFVWTYVTTILPVILSDQPWNTGFVLFALGRFFFIYAICILFDYRDREDDKLVGVTGLITYMTGRQVTYMFSFSLFAFLISTVMLLKHDYNISSVIILLIPGLITSLLYNYGRKTYSDFFFYFVLDGLMAFSALIMLIAGI